MTDVIVIDDLLKSEEFNAYSHLVSNASFSDVHSQELKYSDISQNVSASKLYEALEAATSKQYADVLSFLRAYQDKPEYRHPMWIHSDALFSDYIGIFFVQSSEFPQDDGFVLWRNKELNAIEIRTNNHTDPKNKIVDEQTLDPDKWEMWKRVEFKPNRLVMCPASYFHSTATYGHHGGTLDKCRIVHVLFFNKRG